VRLARIKTIHACRARRKNTFFPRKIRVLSLGPARKIFDSRLRAEQIRWERTRRVGPTTHRISVFEPPLSETPSTKPQAPEKFRNRNTKNQDPNTKEIPSSKLQTAARASSLELLWSLELGVWCLGLGASLELGVWNLELVAWALSFSKIEIRPTAARSEGLT